MGLFSKKIDVYKQLEVANKTLLDIQSITRYNTKEVINHYKRFEKKFKLPDDLYMSRINNVIYIDMTFTGYKANITDEYMYISMLSRNLPFIFCDNENYINLYRDYMVLANLTMAIDDGLKIKNNQIQYVDRLLLNITGEFERIFNLIFSSPNLEKFEYVIALSFALSPHWLRMLTHFNQIGSAFNNLEKIGADFIGNKATPMEMFHIEKIGGATHGR